MKRIITLALLTVCFQCAFANVYYVSTSGNDGSGNGSATSPWRTLKFAVTKVPASQGHSIKLSAGTFVENGQFNVPLGVNIEGSGIDQTFIKAASSFYFYPGDPGFALDKFLMTLSSSGQSNGNQSLKNFTLDGDNKRLHGGIYVKHRNNVLIENVKVQNTNFCGIWIWDVKFSVLRNVKLLNCSWGSTGWASGALQLANLEGVDIDRLNIDEGIGYGIKALGSGGNKITKMKVYDSRISVNPAGKWNNGSAPNIAFELWEVYLVGCEIFNTYLDNHLSLVNVQTPATGIQSIRVHHNTFDLLSRAGGHGYAIELSINDAEIDNNWINGGSYGIANWSPAYVTNWSIHHNTFNSLSSGYPGEIIRSQQTGIHNVKVYNNTVEFTGTSTMNFLGLHKGQSDNIDIRNNLVINSNTSYSWWPNQLIFMEGGATIAGLKVVNNFLSNLAIGTTVGTFTNNLTGNPQITKTGVRPSPFYVPVSGSPLINAGVNLGLGFQGTAPDIGAYETGATVSPTLVTSVSVTPTNVTLAVGASNQLAKTINPSNATNQNVTWTSSNINVATVSSTGLVIAKAAGSATITVKTIDGGKTASATVTVPAPVISVTSVSVSTLGAMTVNSTAQLTKTVGPSNATNQNVTWSSSNTNVATVSSTGLVTAKAVGSATINVKTVDGSKAAAALLTVGTTTEGISSIDIDNATRGAGTNQFNFSGTAWTHGVSSSDPYFNQTVSYSKVVNNAATVSFTGNKVELYTAKASNHGIVAVSIDNGPETNVDLYSASRQNFVLVYGSAGLAQGSHTIKMRVTGTKNSAATDSYVVVDYMKVYSGSSTVLATSVSLSPASVSLEVNATRQLTKAIAPSTATNQNVTWSSSNATVATVSSTGIVTAKAAGNATITVKTVDGNKAATCSVVVNAPSNTMDLDNATRGTGTNQFNYSGSGWTHGISSSDPYFNQTVSYSNVANNFVTVTFSGNKVEFYSAKASNHGIVAVSIDNGTETNVDLYSATRQNFAMVFRSASLTEGTHTIKIRVTGTKNASASGTYAIIDYLKVYSTSVGGGGGSGLAASSVMQEETTEPMRYFPNPVKSGDALHVELPEASGEVTLINLAGVPQRTLEVTDNKVQISTEGLLEGIYLLQYRTSRGREVAKIMIQ